MDKRKKILARAGALSFLAFVSFGVSMAAVGASFLFELSGLALLLGAFACFLYWPFEGGLKKACLVLRRLMALGLVLLFLSFIYVQALIFSEKRGDMESAAGADILVVLGAGLYGSTPSPMLKSRLARAFDYLEKHPGAVAVLSGGQGDNEDMAESRAMALYLEERGIDPRRLYTESRSRNTAQNIKFSMELIKEEGLSGTIAVVSSDFHLYRAKKIFERYGINALALSASSDFNPVVTVSSYVREYCSIVVMYIKDIFGIDE